MNPQLNHILLNPALQERLRKISQPLEIPALPEIYMKLKATMELPGSNAHKAAEILGNEPALTLRLLKVVNSAAYGLRQPVTKVDHAISLLGFQEVGNLVLATTLIKKIPGNPGDRVLDMPKFWEHSIGVAVCARMLCRFGKRLPMALIESSFISGLVHDVGKVMLHQNFSAEFTKALNLCKTENLTLVKAEQKVFGFTHQDIGAYVADTWGFDRNMVKSLELHNTPEELDRDDPSWLHVSVVHVANVLAHFLRFGAAGDPYIPTFHGHCFDRLNMNLSDLPVLLEEAKSAHGEIHAALHA